MSASVSAKPATIPARNAEGMRQLQERLGLDDAKILAAAIAEVVADEVVNNARLSERIRDVYRDLESSKSRKSARPPSRSKQAKPQLVPIGDVEERRIDPYAPLDPGFLLRLYGTQQLPLALDEYSRDTLKVAAETVQMQHPGTKPKSKASKAALIEYIVAQVTGTAS